MFSLKNLARKGLTLIATYHFVSSADEDGHSSGVGALFDNQHLFSGGAEWQFTYNTSLAKFLCCQFLETWHDATTRGDGNQLYIESK